MKAVAGVALGLVLGTVIQAEAIKPGACAVDLEKALTDARLCRGELAVTRGQLRACWKRNP